MGEQDHCFINYDRMAAYWEQEEVREILENMPNKQEQEMLKYHLRNELAFLLCDTIGDDRLPQQVDDCIYAATDKALKSLTGKNQRVGWARWLAFKNYAKDVIRSDLYRPYLDKKEETEKLEAEAKEKTEALTIDREIDKRLYLFGALVVASAIADFTIRLVQLLSQ